MKRFTRAAGAIALMLGFAHSALAQQGNDFWPEARRAQILSVITVHEGTDLHQLAETYAQSRDEVRDKMWDQLMQAAPQSAGMAQALAAILLTFDRMHSMHKLEDKVNYDKTLSVQVQSGFESFMKENHIPGNLRRAEFVDPTASSLQYLLQKDRKQAGLIQQAVTSHAAKGIDFLVALTWSGNGANVQIALSVERIIAVPRADGLLDHITKPTTITINGPWATAGMVAGYELAKLFQTIDPVAPVDPQPGLKWITHFVEDYAQTMTHKEASNICRSQNARLPYADELLLAEKMNAFFPGGLDQLNEHAYFAVADKQREEGQVYFLNKSFASTPTGMVVSEIGLGPLRGYVFCAVGEPNERIKQAQQVYAMIRLARVKGNKTAEEALEYLLMKMDDLGKTSAETYNGQQILAKFGGYPAADIAKWLTGQGYPVNVSAYMY